MNLFSKLFKGKEKTSYENDFRHSDVYIFHGGCHGCTMQQKKGLGGCVECMFFECDWSKPDLNDLHQKKREYKENVRNRARVLAKLCKS